MRHWGTQLRDTPKNTSPTLGTSIGNRCSALGMPFKFCPIAAHWKLVVVLVNILTMFEQKQFGLVELSRVFKNNFEITVGNQDIAAIGGIVLAISINFNSAFGILEQHCFRPV